MAWHLRRNRASRSKYLKVVRDARQPAAAAVLLSDKEDVCKRARHAGRPTGGAEPAFLAAFYVQANSFNPAPVQGEAARFEVCTPFRSWQSGCSHRTMSAGGILVLLLLNFAHWLRLSVILCSRRGKSCP